MFERLPTDADLDGVPLPELEDRLYSHAALVAAETAVFLELLSAFDRRDGWRVDGVKSCAHWLNWKIGISQRTAHDYVRVARALPDLSVTAAAFKSGELSYSRVRAITRVAAPETEAQLVDVAKHSTAAQLEEIVRLELQLAAATDREAPYVPPELQRSTDRHEREIVRLAHDPSAVETLMNAIEAATTVDTERPLAERQADALIAIAEAYLAAIPQDRSGADRTRVSIVRHETGPHNCDCASDNDDTNPHELGQPDDCARGGEVTQPALANGRPLPQAEIDQLECDAGFAEVRIDNEAIAQIGTATASISATLRRQLMFRDGGCAWAACNSVKGLHAHHVQYRSQGGPTTLTNLVLLCGHHHRLLHRAGYTLSHDANPSHGAKRWTVTRPDGTVIDPRPPLRSVRLNAQRRHLPRPDTIVSRWDGTPLDLLWWEPLATAA